MNTGEIIINAVVRAQAIERVIQVDGGATIFVWSANSPEQIEAALAEAGYCLKPVKNKASGADCGKDKRTTMNSNHEELSTNPQNQNDPDEGFACLKCGKRIYFSPYVYASWSEKLTHRCECGAIHGIFRGKAVKLAD